MAWSNRDEVVWNEIVEWEKSLYQYEGNDLTNTYVKWLDATFSTIPEEVQQKFYSKLDQWLFHLHSLLQGSTIQSEAREQILSSARSFHPALQDLSDMKKLTIDQLHYLNQQHTARHRLYSFIQGGVTGSGGGVTMMTDFPLMAIINLRTVQLTAMTYGYDVRIPYEMMMSLKVFHAATLPNHMKMYGWENLLDDLETKDSLYFYDGSEQLTNATWLQEPLKQIMKLMAISLFSKKKTSKWPIISMAIGAGINYQLTRKVTQYAEKYYQYRYLQAKREDQS
ncbi:hypothetical protein J2S13_001404 [Oikeobacillus pervagus]|uniref:ABC transporter substrate-binding protein n=1 Tax=Oikeobacillus pervagus TaxID=1325931 RepID=A0AAJ1SY85_9BACI|nr:EcsC family protein [Oikeobacillus pervagus]MDQ0215005.1 hypothetical protein [Oikeobacillus pervagus]